MEVNPYFPSLKTLACEKFCLGASIFSGSFLSRLPSHDKDPQLFLWTFTDVVREAIYSSEELWQQVWACCKRYNRISDPSFAALLNLPFDSTASQGATTPSKGGPSQSSSNKKSPAAPAKKAAPKKPVNVFALLADDGDDEDEDSSDKTHTEESNKPTADPPKQSATRAATPAKITVLDAPFAIRSLDLSNLSFISETLIAQALQTHGSTIKSLNLAKCYQITLKTALAIKASKMPLTNLTLSGCRNVDDSFVELILPFLANLESLDIGILSRTEFDLFRHHMEWDIMRLDDTWSPPKITKISPSALASITKSCPNLTHLNVSGHLINDKQMPAILEHIGTETLLSLDISFCSDRRNGNSMLGLKRIMPFITNIQHLKCHYVDWTADTYQEDTDFHPTENFNLPCLETLHACNSAFTPSNIAPLTSLKNLCLSDLYNFGPSMTLAPQLTSLVPVNHSYSADANEESMYQFMAKATSLRVLDAERINESGEQIPLRLIHASPNIEKVRNFTAFCNPSSVPEALRARLRFPSMRAVSFHVEEVPEAPVIEQLAPYFPYAQNLKIFGWGDRMLKSSQVAALVQFPFLKSLELSRKIFTFKSPKDLKLLGRLRHLENLSIAVSPSCVAPFFAWRHKFAIKLRKLSIFIVADNVNFPRTLEIATKDIPEWCSSRPQKGNTKMPAYVDPYAGQPLFPSLSEFTISKIGTLSNRLWSLLARDICPNIHTLRFVGDMNPSREFDLSDGPVDNFKEESQTEEVVTHALELWKNISTIHLEHCWKAKYIQPMDSDTPPPPQGYFTKKYRFLRQLREKNIAVFIKFENWSTYRGYKSFRDYRNERDIVQDESDYKIDEADRHLYL